MFTRTRALLVAVAMGIACVLAACAPEASSPTATTPSAETTITTPPGSPSPSATLTPTPTPTPVALPTDCVQMLPDHVLTQLENVPLNDPAAGVPTGVLADGTLVCLWRDARADITYLETTVSRLARGPALDLLNQLADDEGFACYTPSGGTRCEKTWIDEQYPVQSGRTLFWRDDVLIDTSYANLAPSGYTDGIVQELFG